MVTWMRAGEPALGFRTEERPGCARPGHGPREIMRFCQAPMCQHLRGERRNKVGWAWLDIIKHHKTVWNMGVICINMLQLHFGAWQFQNLPPKNCRGSPWTEARLVSSELCGFEVQRISYAGCDGPQCSAFAVQQHVLRSLVPHGADPKQLQASGLKEHCSVILSETKWNWNYVYILIICII